VSRAVTTLSRDVCNAKHRYSSLIAKGRQVSDTPLLDDELSAFGRRRIAELEAEVLPTLRDLHTLRQSVERLERRTVRPPWVLSFSA